MREFQAFLEQNNLTFSYYGTQRNVKLTTLLSSLSEHYKLSTFRFLWPIQATWVQILMQEEINMFSVIFEKLNDL